MILKVWRYFLECLFADTLLDRTTAQHDQAAGKVSDWVCQQFCWFKTVISSKYSHLLMPKRPWYVSFRNLFFSRIGWFGIFRKSTYLMLQSVGVYGQTEKFYSKTSVFLDNDVQIDFVRKLLYKLVKSDIKPYKGL